MIQHPSPNYVSYLRVSTQRQGASGLGLDAQRAIVANYVVTQKGDLLAEYVEVESSRRERPVLVQSISHCRRAGATLLIAKLDRLARNVAFVASLMDGKVDFVAIDAPHANRFMLHIMAAFAEHEREQISTRTRDALAAAKRRGVQLGRNGVVLAAARREEAACFAASLRRPVEEALASDRTSLAQIAEFLNDKGLRTREGASWKVGTIHRLLKRLRQSDNH